MTVIEGDISAVEADALVHPTNASFSLGGKVGMYWNLILTGFICKNKPLFGTLAGFYIIIS